MPGAIKVLFKAAVKAVTLPGNDEPKPEARKRRGGTDSRAPLCVTPRLDRQGGKPSARGRYAALQAAKTGAGKIARRFARAANDNTRLRHPPAPRLRWTGGYGGQAGLAAREDAGLYLASGMALVQFWQDNAQYDFLDDHFGAQQDRFFPQL